MVRGMFVAVVAALSLSGCASPAEEPPEDVDLFREYARSGDVENDPFGGTGSGEDRLANFASQGTPEQILTQLLAATECAADCDAAGATRAAAKDFGGTLYERLVLVKHPDGALEMLPLYVAQKSDDDAVLIDAQGQTYQDLTDFRENNDVLTAEDLVLAPENITSVPGEGRIATVYGQTGTNWLPWLLGGGGVLLLAVALLVVVRRRNRGEVRVRPEPAGPERT
ncbi:MAG: LPXTG cell wall anchor domain-containing protein [Actinophytocola sp.]|uniref:LPXTG cell wall anchor domain-containing protein n=1 Tax=Actinophytocola sp. TaxID=1872138 RepID=UPI003D6A51C9